MQNSHHLCVRAERRKRIILLACGVFALGLTWVLLSPHEREPSYRGHTLSQWLGQQKGHWGASLILGEDPILAIGTNAIPTILEWISYEPSPLRNKMAGLVERFVPEVRRRLFFRPVERANDSIRVFRILGPQARAAIPELTRLALTAADRDRAYRCIESLKHVGPEALSAVLTLASNSPPKTRFRAIVTLPDFGANAAAAVPLLIRCLDDNDRSVANAAEEALTRLDRSAVFPALTNALHSPSAQMRARAVNCIQWLEIPASEASSLLDPLLTDPDYNVRRTTTNSLRRLSFPPSVHN